MGYDTTGATVGAAGHDAATLVGAMVTQGNILPEFTDVFAAWKALRDLILNNSLEVQAATALEVGMSTPTPASRGRAAGGGGHTDYSNQQPGDVVIKGGKHAGKTIAAVSDEDPEWIEWAGENLNNDFLKKKVQAFQAA